MVVDGGRWMVSGRGAVLGRLLSVPPILLIPSPALNLTTPHTTTTTFTATITTITTITITTITPIITRTVPCGIGISITTSITTSIIITIATTIITTTTTITTTITTTRTVPCGIVGPVLGVCEMVLDLVCKV